MLAFCRTCGWTSLILAAMVLGLAASPRSAAANGWEHGAIPFRALLTALDHGSAETRARAAESLGYRGDPAAVAPLLAVLDRPEKDHQARRSIYAALGRLGDLRALAALHGCLVDEQREELRSTCATALGAIASPDSLDRLVDAFENDQDFLVRSRIVDALGNFPQPRSVAMLSDLVAPGGNRSLRLRAIASLGRTGAEASTKPLLEALHQARGEAELAEIVDALGRLHSSAAVQPLADLLAETQSDPLRIQIVVALANIRDGGAYPTLVEMLSNENPAVRFFAVRGLRDLGRSEAVEPLIAAYRRSLGDAVSDPASAEGSLLVELGVGAEIVRAVVDLDPPAGVEVMLDAARPRPVRHDSQRSLRLAEAIYELRRAAVYGLGYSRSQEAAELLAGTAGIGDPDPRIRATAARSLGVLGFPGAARQTAPMLDDPSPEVRWTAAMVLGRLADPGSGPALAARLADPHGEVRRQAVLSLGYLGDPAFGEAVAGAAANDPSERVREAASYAAEMLMR